MLRALASPPHMAMQCTLPAAPATRAADKLITADASLIAIQQRVPAGRLQIVELAIADGPEECPQREGDQSEAERHEYQQDVHCSCLPDDCRGNSRAAFSTTAIELSDMPSAASHGGMSPTAASGTDPKL